MAEKMKALVKAKSEPGLWLEDVDLPEPGDNDVRIKIRNQIVRRPSCFPLREQLIKHNRSSSCHPPRP